RFENTTDGVNIYTQDYRQNTQPYDTLTMISVDYDGNAILKTRYSHLDLHQNFLNNFNFISLSPDKDKILQLHPLVAFRDSTLLSLDLLYSKKCVFFKINGDELNIILSLWGTVEWINKDEFIFYSLFSSSAVTNSPENFTLLISRVKSNGDVI